VCRAGVVDCTQTEEDALVTRSLLKAEEWLALYALDCRCWGASTSASHVPRLRFSACAFYLLWALTTGVWGWTGVGTNESCVW